MGLALALYEKLTEAPDDATRFRLIVDTINAQPGSVIRDCAPGAFAAALAPA